MRISVIGFAVTSLFATCAAYAFDPGGMVGNIVENNVNNIQKGPGGAGGNRSPSGWPEFSDHGMNGDGVGGPTCAPVPTQPSMEEGKCLYLDKLYSTEGATCNKPLFEGPFAGLPACAPGRHPYSSYYDATRGGGAAGATTTTTGPRSIQLAVGVTVASRASCISMLSVQRENASSIEGNPDPVVTCTAMFHIEEATNQKYVIVQNDTFVFSDSADCERRIDAVRTGTQYVKQVVNGALEDIPGTAEFCGELFSKPATDAQGSGSQTTKASEGDVQAPTQTSELGEVKGAEIHFGEPPHEGK